MISDLETVLKHLSFKKLVAEAKELQFAPEELCELLRRSMESGDWATVAKCNYLVQLRPSELFVDVLCELAAKHGGNFNPEDVIETLSSILDHDLTEPRIKQIVDTLGVLALASYDGDPAFNINMKAIANLDWIVRTRSYSGRDAALWLQKAAQWDNEVVATEARECLASLENEDLL